MARRLQYLSSLSRAGLDRCYYLVNLFNWQGYIYMYSFPHMNPNRHYSPISTCMDAKPFNCHHGYGGRLTGRSSAITPIVLCQCGECLKLLYKKTHRIGWHSDAHSVTVCRHAIEKYSLALIEAAAFSQILQLNNGRRSFRHHSLLANQTTHSMMRIYSGNLSAIFVFIGCRHPD